MKQWKKVMAILLSFAMVMMGVNLICRRTEAAGAPQFYADTITAAPGDEIEIPIRISGNTGIMGFGINVGFDKNVLIPIDSVTQSSLISGQFNNSIANALKSGAGTFAVLWQGVENMTADGELFTLKFKVSEQASGTTTLTLALDGNGNTFDENFEDITADCKSITVMVESGKPDGPMQDPEETKKPDDENDPKPSGLFDVELEYYSDDDWTESTSGITVEVDGNRDYAISYTAKTTTANIARLRLSTWRSLEYLPAGTKIVPTTLQVGNKVYPIGTCTEEIEYGYMVTIRDSLYEIDNIVGNVVVPVAEGETITVNFRVEGMDEDGTPTIKPGSTEEPSATQTPNGQNPQSPQVPSSQNVQQPQTPSVKKPPVSPATSAISAPGKVSLKSVKKAGRKKLRVRWKWFAIQDGYQIQRATNRRFTKGRKTVSARKYKSTKTLTGLKSKKTYYVRVRAYRNSNGRKVYGSWSNVKKCKVK